MTYQHGTRFFREVHPPHLNFAWQNQIWMDVIQCCMIIGWTYLASSSFILFTSNLEWLVTKIPKEIFLQLYFYAHFTKDITTKRWKLTLSPESACFRQKLILGKPSNCAQVGKVVSPSTLTFMYLSQDSHNEIYNIYNKYMHL
jgi:hypothetical protein